MTDALDNSMAEVITVMSRILGHVLDHSPEVIRAALAANGSATDSTIPVPPVLTATVRGLAGLTAQARNERKRLMARQPVLAALAFPRSVPKHNVTRWCRESCEAEEQGKEPHFLCWRERGRWYVCELSVRLFVMKRRIS
jgi:hypothetical protein